MPHIVGYTLIAFQEMNICYRYGEIYWQTACLTIDAGIAGDEVGGVNYGEIGRAIGSLPGKVRAPDINKSTLGFTPFKEENKILFGLNPIQGLDKSNLETILEHRPFKSFDDYMNRLFDEGLITVKKTITLIKSGSFDLIEKDKTRRELMIEFVERITPLRDNITLASIPYFMERGIIDEEKYFNELALFNFRRATTGSKAKMNDNIEKFFLENYKNDVEYDYNNDGKLEIDTSSLNRFYQEKIEPIRNYVSSKEAAEDFRKEKMKELWEEECLGSEEQWEMETISFYTNIHEFDYIPINKYFNLIDFFKLHEEPKKLKYGYENYQIGGTVVDKNKGKGIIYLNTQYGVVTVKLWKNVFEKYDEKIELKRNGKNIEDLSWFDRGTKLVLIGYRRGEQFYLNNRNSNYDSYIYKINNYNEDKVLFQSSKIGGE